jgi:hypothetical protein
VTTSLRLLRRLTQDLLGRTPSPAEAKSFLGAAPLTVVQRLLASLEAMQVWLEEELYFFLLIDNFRPKTKIIESIPQRLKDRNLTIPEAMTEIVLSTGFTLRNPGNDTFVTVLYEQLLGIAVQDTKNKPLLEAGKKMYDGKRVKLLGGEGQSQADLVKLVFAEPGCTRHLLDRHHRRLFGAPLGKDQEPLVQRVHEKPAEFLVVLAEWLASVAYAKGIESRRLRTDHQFIRSLYMDLLERTPTYDELRNMRNAMLSMADPTPIRTVMAKVILDSGKALLPACDSGKEAEFVRRCFLRYLGRDPGQQEEQKFVQELGAGAKPEQVVRALVGSLEYQYD